MLIKKLHVYNISNQDCCNNNCKRTRMLARPCMQRLNPQVSVTARIITGFCPLQSVPGTGGFSRVWRCVYTNYCATHPAGSHSILHSATGHWQHNMRISDTSRSHNILINNISGPHNMLISDTSGPHNKFITVTYVPHNMLLSDDSGPHNVLIPDTYGPQNMLIFDTSGPHNMLTSEETNNTHLTFKKLFRYYDRILSH